MAVSFKSLLSWFDSHKVTALATVINFIVGLLAVGVIYWQLEQSNKLKRFENYNYFNKVYSDWYDEISTELKQNKNAEWNTLSAVSKAWVRRYFDLYSEEYYFYKNNMIPNDMWEVLIHGKKGCNGAALLNLREYPVLITGYMEWKKKGAFRHPADFTQMLDKKLAECNLMP